MASRKPDKDQPPRSDDRAWSAHTSVHPRAARADLVSYSALPAETGPTFAPDELAIWPVEGGRYGIEARYRGETGVQRAEQQVRRLDAQHLKATLTTLPQGAAIRLGPFPHQAAWLALEAFLGKPLEV